MELDVDQDYEIPSDLRDQILTQGATAENLLMHPGLREVLEDLRRQFRDAFAATASEERQKREDAYWAIRALDTIEHALKQRVIRAHQLIAILEEDAADEEIVPKGKKK